jgi:hypothetical protein
MMRSEKVGAVTPLLLWYKPGTSFSKDCHASCFAYNSIRPTFKG